MSIATTCRNPMPLATARAIIPTPPSPMIPTHSSWSGPSFPSDEYEVSPEQAYEPARTGSILSASTRYLPCPTRIFSAYPPGLCTPISARSGHIRSWPEVQRSHVPHPSQG